MKLLKQIALVILGVMVISMTACKKDNTADQGQEPSSNGISKKISKVFYSYQTTNSTYPKTLVESWVWNNNNYVDYVNQYNDNGNLEFMVSFSYDNKNRPSRVDCYKYNIYLLYYYDESTNMPTKLDLFENNKMLGTCDITSNNGKLEKLNVTVYETKKEAMLNPISLLLPKHFASRLASFENRIAERNGNESYSYNIQLSWSGNNISKVIAQGDGEIVTITAQYDNKNCPVYAFLLGVPGTGGLIKNNPTTVTMIENSHEPDTFVIDYEYDPSGYPITAKEYDLEYPNYKDILYFEY